MRTAPHPAPPGPQAPWAAASAFATGSKISWSAYGVVAHVLGRNWKSPLALLYGFSAFGSSSRVYEAAARLGPEGVVLERGAFSQVTFCCFSPASARLHADALLQLRDMNGAMEAINAFRRLRPDDRVAQVEAMQQLARDVPIASHVMAYAIRILRATHPD